MAEENTSPISAAKPPVANPIASATSVHAATLKLKPVIRKPTIDGSGVRPEIKLPTAAKPVASVAAPATAPAPEAKATTSNLEQLRSVTQKLKGLTQQIPQQAILRKTGIIAEDALTEAQKLASKSRTARISLSDAIGVAPVKNEAAPMKTIRIKRPVDLASSAAPVAAAVAEPAAPAAAPAATQDAATVTQRKTLKIARPNGTVRPTGKFGAKKLTVASANPAPVADADVADIPDMPDSAVAKPQMAGLPATVCPPDRIPDVNPTAQFLGMMVQIAACVAIGFLAWKLYEITQLPSYCGGALM